MDDATVDASRRTGWPTTYLAWWRGGLTALAVSSRRRRRPRPHLGEPLAVRPARHRLRPAGSRVHRVRGRAVPPGGGGHRPRSLRAPGQRDRRRLRGGGRRARPADHRRDRAGGLDVRIARIVCGIEPAGTVSAPRRGPRGSRPTTRRWSWWARRTSGPPPWRSLWAATSTWGRCPPGPGPRSRTSRPPCGRTWSARSGRSLRPASRPASRSARWRRRSRRSRPEKGCSWRSTRPRKGACSGSSTPIRAPG